MAVPFPRTTRALEGERAAGPLRLVAVTLPLLAGWLAWLALARVPVYEVADTARLEVESAVHPLAAPVLGRVVAARLELGRAVRAGEVLVELDARAERLAAEAARARLAEADGRLAALEQEMAAERAALEAQRVSLHAAVRERLARAREGGERAAQAEDEVRRTRELMVSGGIPELEWERAAADARARRAAAQALELEVDRQRREGELQSADRGRRMAALASRRAELLGGRDAARAELARLSHEVERRLIRAPVAGRLGEVRALRAGAVALPGEALASIVPAGGVRASALFPANAVGRIRPGQAARLRFAAFPSTEYGVIDARVSSVASEPRDARIRVELRLTSTEGSRIPVSHGLQGTAEVEVERTTPLRLIAASAGRALDGPR